MESNRTEWRHRIHRVGQDEIWNKGFVVVVLVADEYKKGMSFALSRVLFLVFLHKVNLYGLDTAQ